VHSAWPGVVTRPLTAVSLLLLLVGCVVSIDTFPVPRDKHPVPCVGTDLGTLQLIRTGTTLHLTDGTTTYRVVWPPRFSAEVRGLTAVVLDSSQSPVAREGDHLEIGGSIANGTVTVCDIDGVAYW
jgi:hypothetical protein